MSEKLSLARLPWTTVSPAALSALDIGDVNSTDFRPKQWLDRPDAIKMQAYENDQAYLAWQEQYAAMKFGLSQVVASRRVGRPANMYTTNTAAITATDTYLALDDALIARTGFLLAFISYNAEYRVLDFDDDATKGWTNEGEVACNARVERLTGPTVAIPAGQVCNAGHAPMGELGVPKRGITSVPGDPVWNTMSLVGIYGSISNLQAGSEMVGNWGTHAKVREDIWYQHRMAKQHQQLFGQRFVGNDSLDVEGQLYLGNGVQAQIKTNVMEAGSLGINLTWAKLNDFWEKTFDSELSASEKDHFCGTAQFIDIRKAALEGGAELAMLGVQSGVENASTIGANTMKVRLQSGKVVNVYELRKAFGQPNLVDWGITHDRDNLQVGVFGDFSERWVENIESPAQQITLRSDAVVDSWLMAVIDESTFGVIRGGTRGLIER